MDSSIDEVFNDFKNSLSGIDFSAYNPSSSEFISALNIGLMWYLLHKINDVPEIHKELKETNKDDISDELFGAKKYFQKYIDTNDSMYKEMANDELKHAGFLIKKANSKLPSGEEKAKLKDYENELKEISEQINM